MPEKDNLNEYGGLLGSSWQDAFDDAKKATEVQMEIDRQKAVAAQQNAEKAMDTAQNGFQQPVLTHHEQTPADDAEGEQKGGLNRSIYSAAKDALGGKFTKAGAGDATYDVNPYDTLVDDLYSLKQEHEKKKAILEAQDPRLRRAESARQWISGIGDALSSVFNVVGTAHGSSNAAAKYTASPVVAESIEKDRARRREDILREQTQINALEKELLALNRSKAFNDATYQRQKEIQTLRNLGILDTNETKRYVTDSNNAVKSAAIDQKADAAQTNAELKKSAQEETKRAHIANEGIRQQTADNGTKNAESNQIKAGAAEKNAETARIKALNEANKPRYTLPSQQTNPSNQPDPDENKGKKTVAGIPTSSDLKSEKKDKKSVKGFSSGGKKKVAGF